MVFGRTDSSSKEVDEAIWWWKKLAFEGTRMVFCLKFNYLFIWLMSCVSISLQSAPYNMEAGGTWLSDYVWEVPFYRIQCFAATWQTVSNNVIRDVLAIIDHVIISTLYHGCSSIMIYSCLMPCDRKPDSFTDVWILNFFEQPQIGFANGVLVISKSYSWLCLELITCSRKSCSLDGSFTFFMWSPAVTTAGKV